MDRAWSGVDLSSGVGTGLAPILTNSRKNTVSIPHVNENKKAAIGIYASPNFCSTLSTAPTPVEAYKRRLVAIASLSVNLHSAGIPVLALFKSAHFLQFLAASRYSRPFVRGHDLRP